MPLHPLYFLATEIGTSILVVGFTSPSSILRVASLPFTAACLWYVVQKSINHMVRSPWAALLGGYAVSFFFQYVDIALLSRWSFDTEGPTYAPAKSSSTTTSSSFTAQHAIPSTRGSPGQTRGGEVSSLQRIMSATSILLNFRLVGTPHQVKNIPPFSTRNPSYIPSQGEFLKQTATTAVISYLILDAITSGANPDMAAKYFSTRNILLLSRLSDISSTELGMRLSATVGLGISMNCVQRGIYSIAASVCVASGISKPASWPPFYGPVIEAYSMRRFWRSAPLYKAQFVKKWLADRRAGSFGTKRTLTSFNLSRASSCRMGSGFTSAIQ